MIMKPNPTREAMPKTDVTTGSFFKRLRDPMSGITHGIGALLAVLGLIVLIEKALNPYKPLHLVTYTVFGIGLTALYTVSTLYHSLPVSEEGDRFWRKLDHMMIFVLIAATYTPFCLIPLHGPWGWGIFGTVWGLAAAGILFTIFWIDAPRGLAAGMYVAMGWVAIVGIWPLVRALSAEALTWLFAGGVFYTVGALIYAVKRPDPWPGWFGFHEVFHIFVIFGSLCHFWTVYKYVSAF
jgi:hemolysin III